MSATPDPPFENLFLKAIADALGRRQKAIRYRVETPTLDRGIDERDGIRFERLNLILKFGLPHGARLHFTAWEDSQGWICLLRYQNKLGRTFKLELYPELWDLDGPEIVRRIEATMTQRPDHDGKLSPDEEEQVRAIWSSAPRSAPKKKKRK